MGRKVDLIEDWVDFTPEIDGNREDDDPMIMEIQSMSSEERRAFSRRLPAKLLKSKEITRGQKLVERILAERVRNIRNYQVGRDVILTGEELAQHGEEAVIDEIYEAITDLSILKEGMREKSPSQSVSSTAKTAPGNGAALGVSLNPRPPRTATVSDPSVTATTKETRTSVGHGHPASGGAHGRS